MATTADVPKVARVAGRGVIMLARESGRPIFPFAMATSRFKRLNNWDRSVISLPFGRGAMVTNDPIYVPRDADDATMEHLSPAAGSRAEGRDAPRLCRQSAARTPMASDLPLTLRVYRSLSHGRGAARRRAGQAPAEARQGRRGARRRTQGTDRTPRARAGRWSGSTAPASARCSRSPALVERMRAMNIRILLTSGTVTSAAIVARRFPPDVIHQFIPLRLAALRRALPRSLAAELRAVRRIRSLAQPDPVPAPSAAFR